MDALDRDAMTVVAVVVKKGRLRQFEHDDCKDDDADWVKCCMMMKFDGTSRRSIQEDLVGQGGYVELGLVPRRSTV